MGRDLRPRDGRRRGRPRARHRRRRGCHRGRRGRRRGDRGRRRGHRRQLSNIFPDDGEPGSGATRRPTSSARRTRRRSVRGSAAQVHRRLLEDGADVPAEVEADEETKAPYVASATKLTDGTFDGTADSVYPEVPTEADVPDEDAEGTYVASSTKFSDGTLDGPDQFDPTGVYPTGGYEKSPEEIETEEGRVEARASEADAYKKAYAAAAIEEEAVGDEHTEVAEEDTGYRGGYVAVHELTDGTYSAALGKHHKYGRPTVNPYGVKDAEEAAAAADADAEEVQEADELESEADAYEKAYAAADAEEQAAGDEHADAADDDGYRGGYVAASTRLTDGTYSKSALGKKKKEESAAAAAEEEEDEKPHGYQSSYTINPYGVKDAEETDVEAKEEDVPVEKPHGYGRPPPASPTDRCTTTKSPRWAARARRRRATTLSTGPTSCRSPRTTTTSPPTTRSWS